MAANAPALTVAAAVVLLVVLSSSSPAAVAQVPPTANRNQINACNTNCANACNVVGDAACPGVCFGTANQQLCTTCKTEASEECLPQCTAVCYSNPDPSITA